MLYRTTAAGSKMAARRRYSCVAWIDNADILKLLTLKTPCYFLSGKRYWREHRPFGNPVTVMPKPLDHPMLLAHNSASRDFKNPEAIHSSSISRKRLPSAGPSYIGIRSFADIGNTAFAPFVTFEHQPSGSGNPIAARKARTPSASWT